MKTSKLTAVAAFGAVGVLALGACSSGSDQAQSDREAEAASTLSAVSPTATPTNLVKMPMPKSGPFNGVEITRAPDAASCETPIEKDGKLSFSCKDITGVVLGDPVFVSLPNDKYQVDIHRTSDSDHPLRTIQRDWLYVQLRTSTDEHTVWVSPYSKPAQKDSPWGVGLASKFSTVGPPGSHKPNASVVITKIK